MKNHCKIFFLPIRHMSINFPIYYAQSIDTWPHLLLLHLKQNIYKFGIIRHNNAIWELHKMSMSNKKIRYFNLLNVIKNQNQTSKNTVLLSLLQCICTTQQCQSNATFHPHMLLVLNYSRGAPHLA